MGLVFGLALACGALTKPPPGLNEFSRLSGRGGALSVIRRSAATAIGRALADGCELLEIEFPPLLETRTQFDDFSNVEELDANRDFGVQLALEPEIAAMAPGEQLWICFADDAEAQLAREAWPGRMYAAAFQTSIAGAICMKGDEPLRPLGTGAADAATNIAAMLGFGAKPPPPPPAPPALLHLVVQPGNGGPMEDWLNLEILRESGTPMVCLNGALDKVTTGYLSRYISIYRERYKAVYLSRSRSRSIYRYFGLLLRLSKPKAGIHCNTHHRPYNTAGDFGLLLRL